MFASYAGIVVFTLIALVFPLAPLLVTRFGGSPQNSAPPTPRRGVVGIVVPSTITVDRFLSSLVWTTIGILLVVIIPWVFAFDMVSTLTLVELVIALAVLVVALLYAWRKGVLARQPVPVDTE